MSNTAVGGDSKCLPLKEGLSKKLQGHDVPMAGEKDGYSPLIGGVANGRGLTRNGLKAGAGSNVKG